MIDVEQSIKQLRQRATEMAPTLRSRSDLMVMLQIAAVMGTLAAMLALFRAALVSYSGSALAWWIVVGVITGLIALQTILLIRKKGGARMTLLGSLFGVIGMLGLAVLAAIFFALAWPGVLIALLAGAWGRRVASVEERPSEAKQPSEVRYQAPAPAGLGAKAEP